MIRGISCDLFFCRLKKLKNVNFFSTVLIGLVDQLHFFLDFFKDALWNNHGLEKKTKKIILKVLSSHFSHKPYQPSIVQQFGLTSLSTMHPN